MGKQPAAAPQRARRSLDITVDASGAHHAVAGAAHPGAPHGDGSGQAMWRPGNHQRAHRDELNHVRRTAHLRTVRAVLAGTAAVALFSAAVSWAALLVWPLLPVWPAAYVASELVFAWWYTRRCRQLGALPMLHHDDDEGLGEGSHAAAEPPLEVFQRAMDHVRRWGGGAEAFLSAWFRGAPLASIGRGNAADLLAYAFFSTTQAELRGAGRGAELDALVAALEAELGTPLAPGTSPGLSFMAHLAEPLRLLYRPLAAYACQEALGWLTWTMLAALGFRRVPLPAGCVAYVRPVSAGPAPGAAPRAAGSSCGSSGGGAEPLVLLHGLGVGLAAYLGFAAALLAGVADGQRRAVVAVEFRHVAQRWVGSSVPTLRQVAGAVLAAFDLAEAEAGAGAQGPPGPPAPQEQAAAQREQQGGRGVALVAHSYGSLVAGQLLRIAPQRIAHLTLVDPVALALFQPGLVAALLYDPPPSDSALADFMMYAAVREPHCAAALGRRFRWQEACLWGHLLPPRTLVVLSGRDALIDTQQAAAWLAEAAPCASVMVHPSLRHAGFLLDGAWMAAVAHRLARLLGE